MMTAAEPDLQTDFLALLGFRPLLTVDDARYILGDCSPDHVRRLIDSGDLRAVDISANWPDNQRREPRVYRFSAELFLARELNPRSRVGQMNPLAVDAASVIPHGRDVLRADEVRRILNCSDQHVLNLSDANQLGPRFDISQAGASSDRTRRIWRHAFINFLKEREIYG